MKYKMTLSQAAMILGKLKVPSDLINSLEVAEAIMMGMEALNMQINLAQMISDVESDFNPADSYSSALTLDMLKDVYIFSEVNDINE